MRRRASKDRGGKPPVGVAPAGGARNPAPGRPWVAVRSATMVCPSMGWTRRGRRRAKAYRIGVEPKAARVAPGSYSPRDRNCRDGAPRGARTSMRCAAYGTTGAPLGAPFPRHLSRGESCPRRSGERRRPPRGRKEYGRWCAPAWLIDNRIGDERCARKSRAPYTILHLPGAPKAHSSALRSHFARSAAAS